MPENQTVRTPTDGKPYYCDHCGAGFGEIMAEVSQLEAHIAKLTRVITDQNGTITTWEAEAVRLEALLAQLDQDPNRLPMKLLPERGWLEHLWSSMDREIRTRIFHCIVAWERPRMAGLAVSIDKSHGIGRTPRAAMLAAIERIPPQHD